MVTYRVIFKPGNYGAFYVVVVETGIIVAGPFAHKGEALAEANLRASVMPGNRVES